jgi:hypothetical protein
MTNGLRLRPISISEALAFNQRVHRRLPKLTGARFAVSARDGHGVVIGVAVVGHPLARKQDDGVTLEVTRVAVADGHKNACSMLYGACARIARAMGADGILTYTHADEAGTSVIAAGWVRDAETTGGTWTSQRGALLPGIVQLPKIRWWAPWSQRLVLTEVAR